MEYPATHHTTAVVLKVVDGDTIDIRDDVRSRLQAWVLGFGGAGACHTDLHLIHDFEPGMLPWNLPFTLGHENAGWVDSVGDGVSTTPINRYSKKANDVGPNSSHTPACDLSHAVAQK